MQQEPVEEIVPVQLECGLVWFQAVEVDTISAHIHFSLLILFSSAITCTSLSLLNNGVLSYNPDTMTPFDFGTTASYSCNEGFFLVGNTNQTCGGDGSGVNGIWSGSAPVCSGICIPIHYSV